MMHTIERHTDPLTAFRIAKERGMAERARVARQLWSAATRSVTGLFSQPDTRE